MRDIIRISHRAPSQSVPQETVQAFTTPVALSPAAAWVERILKFGENAGSAFRGAISPKRTIASRIVRPSQAIQPAPAAIVVRPARRHAEQVRAKLKTATSKAKEAGHRTLAHAKTPLGRVAMVNATAVLALFAYVATIHGQPVAPQATAQIAQQATLRSFLPSTALVTQSTVASTAFQADLSSVPSGSTKLLTWATPWNISDVQAHISQYVGVSAFWLSLGPDGKSVTPKTDWAQWDTFRQQVPHGGRTFLLTVSGNPDSVYLALSNTDIQNAQIQNLLLAVQEHNFDGIDLDYEGLGSENKGLYTDFVRNLTAAFHAKGKQVAVTLEARIANQVPMDWHALGGLADQVRIMAYDYHSSETAEPGPTAPLGWIKEICDYATAQISPKKLVIGLGNYGYDWIQDDSGAGWHGIGVSFDQAMAIAKERNVEPIQAAGLDSRGYDIGKERVVVYKDDSSKQHSVWFEDSESLQTKVNLVAQYQTAGVIFWSIGLGYQTPGSGQSSN